MNVTSAPSLFEGLQQVWRLSWPSIIANLFAVSIGLAHLKIIAPFGADASAAVTTAHRIYFLLQAVAIAISISSAALVSQAWGARDYEEASNMGSAALIISALIALVISLPIILFPAQVVGLFGLDSATSELATSFTRVLAAFNMFYALNMVFCGVLRATGDVITPLWLTFVTSASNIVLSYIFALGVGGLPRLGIDGLGVGMGAAAIVTTVLISVFWLRGSFVLKPRLRDALNFARLEKLLRIGIPVAAEQAAMQVGLLVFFSMVALYGTAAFAAYGIGISLLSVAMIIGLSFGLASATLTGQLLGAGDPQAAIRNGWRSLWLTMAVMCLLALAMVAIAKPLANSMTNDPEVASLTVSFLYILAVAQPFIAVEFAIAGALRGAGDTLFPLKATLIGLLAGRIGLALIFVWLELSVFWIYSAAIADYGLKSVLLIRRFRSGKSLFRFEAKGENAAA